MLKHLRGIASLSIIVSLSVSMNLEARRCCRGNGGAVAAGIFAGAIAGAAIAGSCDVDCYGYYDPYVPPAYRVYYPGAPILAYDYPTYKYSPMYAYAYDSMYAPGYYRPIY